MEMLFEKEMMRGLEKKFEKEKFGFDRTRRPLKALEAQVSLHKNTKNIYFGSTYLL